MVEPHWLDCPASIEVNRLRSARIDASLPTDIVRIELSYTTVRGPARGTRRTVLRSRSELTIADAEAIARARMEYEDRLIARGRASWRKDPTYNLR